MEKGEGGKGAPFIGELDPILWPIFSSNNNKHKVQNERGNISLASHPCMVDHMTRGRGRDGVDLPRSTPSYKVYNMRIFP